MKGHFSFDRFNTADGCGIHGPFLGLVVMTGGQRACVVPHRGVWFPVRHHCDISSPRVHKLYQGRFRSPPSHLYQSDKFKPMHPGAMKEDINKHSWRVNITHQSGWEGTKGKERIFFHPLMEPSTITFQPRDGVTRRMAVLWSKAEGKHHYHRKHCSQRWTSRPSKWSSP